MKIGLDGLSKYYKYYPAPREPALMRALLAAQAFRAAYIGAAAGAYSAAFAQGAAKAIPSFVISIDRGISFPSSDLHHIGPRWC